jgi:hypothetical protein
MSARIPRLEFDELAPSVQEVLAPRYERLGYLGEFFKCAGHQPALLAPFQTMTEAFKTVLPDRLVETAALTVANAMGNDYERHQHERLCVKLGFGTDWIADVSRLAPDEALSLGDAERRVQRLALAMLSRRGKGCSAEVDAVIDAIGPERTVAVLFVVGRYAAHALMVNALELAPPVPSVFAEQRP